MKYLLSVVLLISTFNSYAIETISIERGHVDPTPIAINKFETNSQHENVVAQDIISVITNDLKISGMFRPISSAAFIEQIIGIHHKPLFASWRQINASLLLNGTVSHLPSGKLKVSFILWDTNLEKNLIGEFFEVQPLLWRRVAHKIADKIYEKITGDKGYFDTKVAYVSESGPYLNRMKRIAVMDYDGANQQYLTDGKNLVLTPRFAPASDKLLYLAYLNKRKPHVYVRDLKTNKDSLVGNFPGMSFAPRFSPNGQTAIMSIAQKGATHIFEIDLNTKQTRQLTTGSKVINTSPSYSPDGSKIVFNSDRSGTRQLYIMNADGSNVERISFGSGVYAAPSWSPRGDYIAFTKITPSEGFTIGVLKPHALNEENNERIITSGYLVEGACWGPNGRIIMFTKGWPSKGAIAGRSRIYSIDLTGYNEREMVTNQDASDPEWSKILN
ncbi:Tol-Pal system beta propeller repeat protein TolB [Candidatus Tisiphia endosymbiont of Nemotelus uliginosus]|uniref:Tol-Pal system beta propeller repeat protein TolB n=1 Tax=Candidatus Tisiphia endosymbiont of Nemotelus uliginosus TaxID=3077926 RepID=UPI0035C88370